MKTTTTPRPYEDAARIVEHNYRAAHVETMAALLLGLRKDRSAWGKGVTEYAEELIEGLCTWAVRDIVNPSIVRRDLLGGARDWHDFSWGGCSLIYNRDIAERLCTPSELMRTKGGARRPNSREEWLDVQARALWQAADRAEKAIKTAVLLLADLAENHAAEADGLRLVDVAGTLYHLTPDGWQALAA